MVQKSIIDSISSSIAFNIININDLKGIWDTLQKITWKLVKKSDIYSYKRYPTIFISTSQNDTTNL